jgi:hypothetical protein
MPQLWWKQPTHFRIVLRTKEAMSIRVIIGLSHLYHYNGIPDSVNWSPRTEHTPCEPCLKKLPAFGAEPRVQQSS